jgi:four helix bundle protein
MNGTQEKRWPRGSYGRRFSLVPLFAVAGAKAQVPRGSSASSSVSGTSSAWTTPSPTAPCVCVVPENDVGDLVIWLLFSFFLALRRVLMARYEHLPIYKKAFDLFLYFEKIVRKFSRYDKYTLGADLRDSARSVLKLIVRANSTHDKRPVLEEIRTQLEELMILVRVAKEVKAFENLNSYQFCAGEIIEISRQNEGWLRSLERKQPESLPPIMVVAQAQPCLLGSKETIGLV